MSKVTLDKDTFKALASEARLEILKALDGRQMNLSELAKKTRLNKATIHEHLTKLHEAKLVKKKEREGHKWVYYKLAWKGSSLIHPENTKIVVLLSTAFVFLCGGILQLWWYAKGKLIEITDDMIDSDAPISTTKNLIDNGTAYSQQLFLFTQDPIFLYAAVMCFVLFVVILSVSLWKFRINREPKL